MDEPYAHRALDLRPPEPDERRERSSRDDEIHRCGRLGGLIHEYLRSRRLRQTRIMAYGVPKLGARDEKSAICRQDANFGTPHASARRTARTPPWRRKSPPSAASRARTPTTRRVSSCR